MVCRGKSNNRIYVLDQWVDILNAKYHNPHMYARKSLPVLLLCLFTLQAGSAIPQHSVTIDEYAHIPAGYSYWKTAVFTVYHQNPPLVKLWCTLPFLFMQPALGFTVPSSASPSPRNQERWLARCLAVGDTGTEQNPWECGRLFLKSNYSRYRSLVTMSRIMVLLLALGLGFLLFSWAHDLYGYQAALLALFLYTFCPNMLAHSQIATLDVGLCLTTCAALYALWFFCKNPGVNTLMVSGIVLGLAQLSKYTALLLYPTFLFLVIVFCYLDRRSIQHHLLGLAAIFLLSLLVVDAGYLFQGMFADLKVHNLKSIFLSHVSQTSLGRVPLPFPFEFIQGFDTQMREAEGGHIVFLNGILSTHGWWYYFLEAFALKTPLPLLLLVVLRCMVPVRHVRAQDTLFFAVPIFMFFLTFSFITDIDIGLRYILPVYPLIFLWVAPLIGVPWSRLHKIRSRARQKWVYPAAIVLYLLLYAQSAVRIFPHHLSYFNLIAGGPENGHRYLIDSNIDWGQDLPQLKRILDDRGISRISLAYFGVVAPEVYGISYDLPNVHHPPRSEYLAVSVSILQGKGEWFPRSDGTWVFLPENALTWVKKYTPVARAGYSIYLYKFP